MLLIVSIHIHHKTQQILSFNFTKIQYSFIFLPSNFTACSENSNMRKYKKPVKLETCTVVKMFFLYNPTELFKNIKSSIKCSRTQGHVLAQLSFPQSTLDHQWWWCTVLVLSTHHSTGNSTRNAGLPAMSYTAT